MLSRLRRPMAVLVPVLFVGLAACGGDDGAKPYEVDGPEGFDAVEITGEPGSAPEVTWKGQMEADDLEVKVLSEGKGEPLADGDSVSAQLWIGNGFTKGETYSTYGKGGDGEQQLQVSKEQLAPIFYEALEGQKKGSRVAVVGSAAEAFGDAGQPSLGIGNGDTVLLVADLLADPKPVKPVKVPASQLPSVIERKGKVTGLDFAGVPRPKPKGDLLRAVVTKGDGPVVTQDQTVTANYLGQVYGAKKPFDESFSKDPIPFSLQQVVKGWTYGLSGVPVGSRVILQIPPALGYGDAEQPNIPANSTLYFVVDIISAE